MAKAPAFVFRNSHVPVGAPTRAALSSTPGQVELVDGSGLPAVATPTDADILNGIGALNRKLQQITKNQQTIESKLNHLATRVAAADANLIMGVQYLTRVMTSVGWWVVGDNDTAEETYPATPHWQ
jgi:hypothetical protein